MDKVTDVTSIAVKATPPILEALGAPKNLVRPICKAVKTVGCKDQGALTKAINAQGAECAKISERYVKMLNEAIQAHEEQRHSGAIQAHDEQTLKKQSNVKTALSLLGKGVGLTGGIMGTAVTLFMYRFAKAFSDSLEDNPFGDDT